MFGPYELRSLIGVGRMGEAYQAYDTVKDRVVAVKLLRPELSADPGFQEGFRRESRVAARLQEPHVIPVHDWGEINGVLFIDMCLVEGSNVKSVLRKTGPMDPARAVSIVGQVVPCTSDAGNGCEEWAGVMHVDRRSRSTSLEQRGLVERRTHPAVGHRVSGSTN